ncbi:amino acid ABC transporter permease [Proteiniclasticum sp. BAD-10]|uniref:Amino acid ABC transporter permease n=1 Tax=Proteiniclasticum sediminis TaxID=2804028 RepID=A0A941CPX8_9CLOT|nr:amino acid ABC transporter permease [Proteiniclasticum sediminis]MBR0575238.1 amino acid ABC transporter permease [Proteiniclasticum sediminis]
MNFQLILKIAADNWPMFLRGMLVTLQVSILSTILGTLVGLLIGIIRTIPLPEKKGLKRLLLRGISGILSVYIEVFRGTPMIVQAMIIYYGVANNYGIAMDKTFAAILIVTINTGAYMSEIVRGGILSVDKGQYEAAQSIGMTHFQTMINVVLPQVMRNILPATGNEFVINIKDTSVLNVISVSELFFATKSVAGVNFKYMETYTVAALIYLVLTFSVTRILRFLERKMEGPENYNLTGNQMQVLPADRLAKKNAKGGTL